jgi:hypothetical protein
MSFSPSEFLLLRLIQVTGYAGAGLVADQEQFHLGIVLKLFDACLAMRVRPSR